MEMVFVCRSPTLQSNSRISKALRADVRAYLRVKVFLVEIPGTLALIVEQAFNPQTLVGGAAGSFLMTLMWGIRRGLFSNEAGQGSAPIAHAAAKTDVLLTASTPTPALADLTNTGNSMYLEGWRVHLSYLRQLKGT